jgi:hypothetical protein
MVLGLICNIPENIDLLAELEHHKRRNPLWVDKQSPWEVHTLLGSAEEREVGMVIQSAKKNKERR